ncbi:MAG: hypothetical protein JOY82_05290 [Streptosporangiaceae bacterium]|nr:hypothetical protein [Streptosporangiaceae bacterium]MBV9853924.1 hypothetical protein [Streptosporangiaceae bacterium]
MAAGETPARGVAAGSTAVFPLDLPVGPAKLWSPDSPLLYTARAEVLAGDTVADTVGTPFGIRSRTCSPR